MGGGRLRKQSALTLSSGRRKAEKAECSYIELANCPLLSPCSTLLFFYEPIIDSLVCCVYTPGTGEAVTEQPGC